MKFVHTIGAAVGAALLAGTVSAMVAPSAFAVTTPASAITQDPNASNGTLTFYDATGNVITSGDNLSRLFDYAAASTDGRTGANKATIYFAFPDHTQADSQNWYNTGATTPATYPNATNPAPLTGPGFTHPVAKALAGDANLAAILPTTTQDHTAGYDGILQIRLQDSGPGVPVDTTAFWATDIYYDATAGTWQQVFPAVAVTTSTTLSASPAGSAAPNSTITLTATVSPSAAAGTVQFTDGGTNLGAPVTVSGGTAQTTTSYPTTGSHAFSATFTPSDSSAYTSSTSNTVNYKVADGSSLSIGKSVTIAYGKSTTVTGTLTDTTTSTAAANQPVFLYHRASSTAAWVKGTSLTTGSTGKVSFLVKPTGQTLYQLRFPGSSTLNAATSGTETVKVQRLVSINVTPATPTHGKTFAVWGGITPSASGIKMTLQRKSGSVFKTVTTASTKKQKLPNGKTAVGYVFHVVQSNKGTYTFRVLSASTSSLVGGTSATKSVRVI